MREAGVVIVKQERRPCLADGQRANFHKWTTMMEPVCGGTLSVVQHSREMALIEYPNGCMDLVDARSIVFTDQSALDRYFDLNNERQSLHMPDRKEGDGNV